MPTGAAPPAAWPRPARPRLPARLAYLVQRLLAPNVLYRRLARLIEATRPGNRLFTAAEKAVKTELFGCRMCGQCALPVTGYACPMTCPKQLRNGPCGGVGADGSCEVYPGQRCVWLIAYERAEQQGRVSDLRLLQRPIDQRQWGRSSWVSYWSGRDEGLWSAPRRPPGTSVPAGPPGAAPEFPLGRRGDGPVTGVLRARLAAGEVAVTAEVGPPRGADAGAIGRKVEPLRGWVDAVNITDNQGANARLSSLAGSVLSLAAGVEPVMQLTCRDRNRIALQSELLSAGALGIPNVLLMTGDHPRFGDHPDAKPVFDLDSVQLLMTARTMRDEGRLLSGRALEPPPSWLIGSVENPLAPPASFRAARLGKKADAGAEFVQTQYVFALEPFARWLAEVRDLGLDQRCRILAGVGPIRSLRALEHMSTNVPGLSIPDEIGRRLRGVPGDRVADEGMALCAELIQQLLALPGVSGVHVMAPGFERGIPEVLERAGLQRRPPPAAADGSGNGWPAAAGGEVSRHAH